MMPLVWSQILAASSIVASNMILVFFWVFAGAEKSQTRLDVAIARPETCETILIPALPECAKAVKSGSTLLMPITANNRKNLLPHKPG